MSHSPFLPAHSPSAPSQAVRRNLIICQRPVTLLRASPLMPALPPKLGTSRPGNQLAATYLSPQIFVTH